MSLTKNISMIPASILILFIQETTSSGVHDVTSKLEDVDTDPSAALKCLLDSKLNLLVGTGVSLHLGSSRYGDACKGKVVFNGLF